MTNQAILELCNIYYNENMLEHAKRVANKAKSLYQFFDTSYSGGLDLLYQLGLAHDLYENTNITKKIWFDNEFEQNLNLLTKPSNINYYDYIQLIKNNTIQHKEIYMPAYIVKLADISDILSKKEELTEEEKEKYLTAISYLI